MLTILMHVVLLLSCYKQIDHERTINTMKYDIEIKIEQVNNCIRDLQRKKEELLAIEAYLLEDIDDWDEIAELISKNDNASLQ